MGEDVYVSLCAVWDLQEIIARMAKTLQILTDKICGPRTGVLKSKTQVSTEKDYKIRDL